MNNIQQKTTPFSFFHSCTKLLLMNCYFSESRVNASE